MNISCTASRARFLSFFATLTFVLPLFAEPPDAATLADVENRLEASLRAYTVLQRELDRTQAALAATDAERAALADQLEAIRQNNSAGQTYTTRLEQETHALRSEHERTSGELNVLREQLRQTQASLAAFALENRELKTRFALHASPTAAPIASPVAPAPLATESFVDLPAPVEPAPAPATEPRYHTVAPGETLGKIALAYYGTARRWQEIYEANRDIVGRPDALTVGARIVIP